ncbi:MAG: hypothetical protein ACHQQQ_08545 [Bacteroidota bacterium]
MANAITDENLDVSKESQTLEASLRTLWEKIKTTADVLHQQKQDNAVLRKEMEGLIAEVASLRRDLSAKDHEVKRLRAENTQLIQTGSDSGFSDEEKEMLKTKIKDLIAKINSHL